jgi:general secretion pathway protein D
MPIARAWCAGRGLVLRCPTGGCQAADAGVVASCCTWPQVTARPVVARPVVARPVVARQLLALLLLAAVAGCERAQTPVLSPLAPPLSPLPDASLTAPPRISGGVGSSQGLMPPMVSLGTPESPAAPGSPVGVAGGDISLTFADTDIREVVAQILGTILKVNYTIDPAVHGTATLRTVQPVARSQLLSVLQSLLAQNGAALVQSGTLYRVVPVAQAAAVAAAAEGTAGTVAVLLDHASAEDLAKLLQPFVGDGGKIAADPGRNALLVSGTPNTRDSLIDMIRTFDVDILAGQSYALLPVDSGGAKEFASSLQDAFHAQTGGPLAGQVRVMPMTHMNAVLVIAAQPRMIEQVRRVYALIDKARRRNTRSWHVDYLQNSHAEDVAYVLQQAFTPNNVTAQPTSQLRARAGATGTTMGGGAGGVLGQGGQGGFGSGGQGGMPGGGGFGAGGGIGQGASPLAQVPQASAQAQGQALPAAATPLAGPLEADNGEISADALRIIPDPQNNALLIYGTGPETDTIEAMLHKIDIMPLQVRVDAVIAEVTLNDNLQYGTQFFFQSGGINGILNFATQQSLQTPSQATLNLNFPGFFLGGRGAGGAPFALNALQQVTTVRVLSSPQLMVLDNQPARLQVGNVVPYLSQSSQSTLTANAPVISSINYQQTGVILDVTPRVNSGGLVTLDISQEVSDVSNTITTPGINSPTFFDRSISSRVVVQDDQTIGLAGLISDNTSTGNQGIPWLKDIPILGALAGNQNNTRQRTELLMLLTPHVMHDQRDARTLTEDMREQLINAAAVPDQLNRLRPSGSPDPNARIIQKVNKDLAP